MKILFTIILFLLTSSGICYPQNNKSNGGALYAEPSINADAKQNNDNGGALFRATPASGLTDRPGDGEGIGQDDSVPISEGLCMLLGYCVIYGLVKFSLKKLKLTRYTHK